MKIKKYDAGGMAIYAPFISSRGIPQQPSAGVMSESKSSEKTAEPNYWDKEFLKMIEENALPSDFAAGYQELIEIAQRAQSLSGTSLFGGPEPSMTMSDVLQAKFIANKWKAGRDAYDKASQNLTSEKAWNEVATTSTGNIYVYKDNSITTVTPEEFAKNIDDYAGRYLTNSELLAHRHDDIAYHDKWSIDAGGTIGLQTIHKQLLDTIKEFSTTSISEYVKRTGNNISQSAWKGMQILLGEGPDGYYNVTTKTEMEDVNAAVKYLWNTIGEDGRAKLKAEVAIQGKNPNKADDRYELILSMLQMHTGYSQDPSFEKGATEYDPDGDGKGAKPQLEDDPYLSVIAKGKGIRERLSLTPSVKDPMGTQVELKVWGINIGPLVDKNGNIIEQTSLPDALKRGEVFRGRPDNNVTFGNKVLTSEEQKTIITDENAIVYIVEMPYRETINGVVPDFSMVDVYEKVNKLLKETTNNIQRTELLIQHGIDPSKLTIDEEGNWSLKTKLFTRVPGYISEDLTELTDDNKRFMDPVDESEGNQKRKLFNKILKYGIQNPGKNAEAIHSTWDWFGGGDWDRGDMHRGYFYVTAPDEWIAALLTGQNKIDKHLLTDIDKRIYMSRAQQDSPLITQL